MKGGGKAGNDAGYQSSPFTGKGLLVTDELINHAHHNADSASVTAKLRPHSFNHLTARANTFQARFCLCRHGNITTHRLVRLPRTGSVWHLSGFAFLLAVHTLFSWTQSNSLRLNNFFFFFLSQFSQSFGHVTGFTAKGKLWNCPYTDIPSFYIYKSTVRFLASPFFYLAFITIYLTVLLSGDILLYIFHVSNQKPSL